MKRVAYEDVEFSTEEMLEALSGMRHSGHPSSGAFKALCDRLAMLVAEVARLKAEVAKLKDN